MLQSLDVISINLWQILISLANLVILFLIVKKFLFKPVKKLFAKRQAELDHQYAAANAAEKQAQEHKAAWEKKLQSANEEADGIIKDATDAAKYRATQIVEEANAKAAGIQSRAEAEALLTQKRAEEEIKKEIVEVSSAIAEKMLEREINEADHRALIDTFLDEIGEDNGADQ
ncbi:MAG: F0F1 ATP synthase subunit B [Ruminococcaceae bacterium]|nr:F0F1 ATP synthase subunit B [Oscillospiraceae bacterium]